MCLFIKEKITDKVLKKFADSDGKIVTMWKVVVMIDGRICTPYQEAIVRDGIFKSNRRTKKLRKLEIEDMQIENGIHVFINKIGATKETQGYTYRTVMPVYCRLKDFVAAGKFYCAQSAVFTKVEIKKEDLDAVKQELKRR